MFLAKNLFYLKNLVQLNYSILLFSLVFGTLIFYLSKTRNSWFFFLNNSISSFIRYFLIFSVIASFSVFCLTFYFYNKFIFYFFSSSTDYLFFLPNISSFFYFKFWNVLTYSFTYVYFSLDFFGMFLLMLSYLIGFISLLTLDTRLYWRNIKYLFTFNLFLIIVYLFVSVSNILIFFFLYELLLLPSFLFVYFISPSRRAIQASIYFVVWTQIGSIIVLCCISYIVSKTNCYDFYSLKFYNFTSVESFFLYFFIFLGFGIKVPIWPFHYWLTKTHVEAPSGFSVYLSGFLVKSALYGFYKLSNSLNINVDTTFFVTITVLGVVDSSLKMWGQTDLKKLVAYGTVQEMNIILLVFCWGDSNIIAIGIIFCLTHGFLSALMFFLVDCIYRRFHTRSIVEINGILHLTPNLGILIFLMCMFFSGLPGTIKFISEFYIFCGFLELSSLTCFIYMFAANVFGLIGFSKCWFNVLFGMNKKNLKYIPLDLTLKEFIIISSILFNILLFSFLPNIYT